MVKKLSLEEIAEECKKLASMSTCLRMHFGAVIFKNGIILSRGFNYPVMNCEKECIRDKMNVHHGQRLELCYAIHAEQVAICNAAKRGIPIFGADVMVVGIRPNGEILWRNKAQFYCSVCARLIIGAGLARIYGVTKEGITVTYPEDAMKFAMKVAIGDTTYEGE